VVAARSQKIGGGAEVEPFWKSPPMDGRTLHLCRTKQGGERVNIEWTPMSEWRPVERGRRDYELQSRSGVLEPENQEHKTHMNTIKPILFGAIKHDNFYGFYCLFI
jgi:hypothetical protein